MFDPKEHMTNLKGKDYLDVKWRLVWFREDHPKGQVLTELVNLSPLIYKATVIDKDGGVLATGHGSAVAKQGAVWAGREVEKAETAAIGRALGHAGYGTQFTDEDEGDYLADSPVDQRPATPKKSNGTHAPAPGSNPPPDSKPSTNGHSETTPTTSTAPKYWSYDYQALMGNEEVKKLYKEGPHRKNVLELLNRNHAFSKVADVKGAVWKVMMYHRFRETGDSEEDAIAATISAPDPLPDF